MREARFTKESGFDFKKLDGRQRKEVAERIEELRVDPLAAGTDKLETFDVRRAKVKDLRVLYTHDEEFVDILKIGQRNDDEIYKWLRRNYRTSKPETNEYGY